MQRMNTAALIPVATDLSVSYADVYAAFHEFVTGCHWPNTAARTEANRLIGQIRYRHTQIGRDARKLVSSLTGTTDTVLADRLAGLILIDAAEQYGWAVRRISNGYVVLKVDDSYQGMSQVNQSITARRDMLSLMNVVLGQIKAHIASSGCFYEEETP